MMQMPLSSYPHFSQFLQLQQLHHQHQQRYSRGFLTSRHDLGMFSSSSSSHRSTGGTSCSEASTGTPSPSPSPPLSVPDGQTQARARVGHHPGPGGKSAVKSFTIDAILGIRDRDGDKMGGRDDGSRGPGSTGNGFRPRLALNLSGTVQGEAGVTPGYPAANSSSSSSLDLSNATLEISRFSTSPRELLGFQLPTDLRTTSEKNNFGSEMTRRNLQSQISTFQNSNSCTGLTEKSPGDGSKKCGGKSKRVRTIFTPEQLERLEAEFERQQYMVGPERLYLAHTLQLTEAQVKVWFQNRRIKWRKQHLEIQQQRLAAIKQQSQRSDMDDTDDDEEDESGDSNNFTFPGMDTSDGVPTGDNHFYSTNNNTKTDVGDRLDVNSEQFPSKLVCSSSSSTTTTTAAATTAPSSSTLSLSLSSSSSSSSSSPSTSSTSPSSSSSITSSPAYNCENPSEIARNLTQSENA